LSASKMIDEDQNKRIERLRERIEKFKGMLNTPVQCPQCDLHLGSFRQTAMTNHIITRDQIDAAWIYVEGCENPGERDWMLLAFDKLGIVRCEGCGGSGKRESRSSSMKEDPMLWTCPACHGHGWIIHPNHHKTSASMKIEEVEDE